MSNQSDAEERANTGKDRNSRKDGVIRRSFRWIWNHINNRASAWQAIFAGILTIFTFFLYRVSDRATETSRATQRAFVSFAGLQTGVKITGPANTWLGQEVALGWINSGNTPAKSVVIYGNVQAWRGDLPVGFSFPENKLNSPAVIGPKSNYGNNVTLSKTDIMDAWHATSRIFFWGSVLYKDAFPGDPERLSEFCAEMTHVTLTQLVAPQQGKPTQTAPQTSAEPDIFAGFQWQACREHNCYDQDCKDYDDKVKTMRE